MNGVMKAGNEMPEQESPALRDNTIKILTVAGPLLASSLAITYDVGFFVGVGTGFFSFFSLSEHLVFALQSLPFAIPPVAILLFSFTTGWYGYRLGQRDAAASIEGLGPKCGNVDSTISKTFKMLERSPWAVRSGIGIWWLCAIYIAWAGQYAVAFLLVIIMIITTIAVVMSPSVLASVFEEMFGRRSTLAALCAVALLVLSFLIGLQRAGAILTSRAASETISVENNMLPARLIRGGDKGILFFSLDSKQVRFLRWDAIKQIETL